MKRIILLLLISLPFVGRAQEYENNIKVGGGYAHDFPGLNGYAAFVEYSRPLSSAFRGGIGLKHSNMNGFPRTAQIKEYTKATSLDFALYYVPFMNDEHEVRIGAGYSFSFYKILRSYPIQQSPDTELPLPWQKKDKQGRVSGLTLLAEYEYLIPNSNWSFGARGSLYKAYDHVIFGGVFMNVGF